MAYDLMPEFDGYRYDLWKQSEPDWPNCSVPDCEYKSCLALSSDRCYHHTLGSVPPDPAEYFDREAPEELDEEPDLEAEPWED